MGCTNAAAAVEPVEAAAELEEDEADDDRPALRLRAGDAGADRMTPLFTLPLPLSR